MVKRKAGVLIDRCGRKQLTKMAQNTTSKLAAITAKVSKIIALDATPVFCCQSRYLSGVTIDSRSRLSLRPNSFLFAEQNGTIIRTAICFAGYGDSAEQNGGLHLEHTATTSMKKRVGST